MAHILTFVVYTATGATTDFVFPFSYLDPAHIKVTVDGAERSFELIAQNTVRIAPAPRGLVRIFRDTPGQALVVWNDGAVILGKDLNTSGTQPRLIAEEARDIALEARAVANTNLEAAQEAVAEAEGWSDTAQGHATAAATSAAQANATRQLVEGIYDSFDDRYLGMKSADPTVDNDGAALQIGAIHFNTTVQQLRIFTQSGWLAAYIPSSNAVNSFNGRIGTVVPVAGDYDVAKITGLQTALDGKAPTTHDHAGQAIIPDTLRVTRASQLTGAVDLNTVLVGGLYDVSASTNKPAGSSNWGYLHVQRHSNSSDFCAQTWINLDDGTSPQMMWVRTRTAGAWGAWRQLLFANVEDQTVTGGARTPLKLKGNAAGITFTPDPGDGAYQQLINNGAFTVAAPTQEGALVLYIFNTTGAGACTFAGFNKVDGDTFSTATANWLVFIYSLGNLKYANVKAIG